jgi:hypothetical protein
MGDQANPFGRPDGAEPGWANSGRSRPGSGDRRARRTVAGVLVVAVVATVAAISAEVAGIAPFGDSRATASASMSPSAAASGAAIEAAASEPTPADLTQPSGSPIFPPPTGQWLSQGTVVSEQRTNDLTGSVLVRAWTFKDICRRGSCHTEFVRQLASGATDETELVPGSIYRGGPRHRWVAVRGSNASAPYYTASFPPIMSACYSQAAPGKRVRVTQHPEYDQFVLRRTSDGQQLLASDTDSTTCEGLKNFSQAAWTATAVPQPAGPAIEVNPQHAPSVRAFRASVVSVCGRLNDEVLPIAAKLAADAGLLNSATQGSKAEDAAASVARLLPKLTALAVDPYSEVQQPPRGPLDALWLRDVDLNRGASGPIAGLVREIATASLAVRRFDLTRNPVAAQYARAAVAFAIADARRVTALLAPVAAIDRQLELSASCVTPPALRPTFTAL